MTAGVCGVLGWWDVAGSFISRRTESVHLSVLGWDTSETAATRPGSGPGGSESAEGSGGLLLDRILSILGVGKCPHYNYVSRMNRAARPLQRTIVTLTSQDIEQFTNNRVFNDFYQNPYRLRGLLRGMSVLRTFRAFAEHTCYRG